MYDTGREFLEEQVETADSALDEAVKAFFRVLDDVDKRFKDAVAYRGALEAYTRDSDNPYKPAPMVNPILNHLNKLFEAGLSGGKQESASKTEPPAQLNQPKKDKVLPSPNSKVGVALRVLMGANGRGMRLNEVFQSQAPDAPIKLTKGDLYRALPRLVSDDFAWRDSEGRYHAGPKPEGIGVEEEEQDERLLLAG